MHCDGERFVVRADAKLTAFLELEAAIRKNGIDNGHRPGRIPGVLSALGVFSNRDQPDPLSAGLTVSEGLVHTTTIL